MTRNILKTLAATVLIVAATASLSTALGAGKNNTHATPEMQAQFPDLF